MAYLTKFNFPVLSDRKGESEGVRPQNGDVCVLLYTVTKRLDLLSGLRENANVSPLREKSSYIIVVSATKKKILLLSPVTLIGAGSKDAVAFVIPRDPAGLWTHWKTITVWYELSYSDWRLYRDKNLSPVGNNHVSFSFFLPLYLGGSEISALLLKEDASTHYCSTCPHRQTFTQ